MNTRRLLPFFLFFILLTVFSFNIPFFWDGTFFSGLSVHFFENGFGNFIAPASNDTGAFPLFSVYLTACWKLFGKNLLVSHLALLPFLLGITYEYFKVAKRFLSERMIIFSMLLLIVEPVLLTQSIVMGYDILIAYFFLLALNALDSNKRILYSIALILLCIMSIRGMMLAAALFVIDIVQYKKVAFSWIKAYLPALLLLALWTIFHHQQTGWYIFSPTRANNAEQFGGIKMMLRQFIYIIWKNIDLGRIALWTLFIFTIIYQLRKKRLPLMKELTQLLFIPLLILTICMIVIKNPIGPKYFLPIFLLLNIAVCYVIDRFESKKIRTLLFCSIAVCLIAGNFIVYPQRFGNTWDASLKSLPYFEISAEMDAYILSKNINVKNIGTQFPLTADSKFTKLSAASFSYTDIENQELNNFSYFLYSNIINTNRIKDLEKIQKEWPEEKTIESGGIRVTLYKNPSF